MIYMFVMKRELIDNCNIGNHNKENLMLSLKEKR